MKNLNFLHGIDDDLKQSLIKHLRDLWTHTSTAIEGNTLSLGETAFVLEEGLTVSGKPLKDHEEVVGHAIAIELIFSYITRNSQFTKEDLFALLPNRELLVNFINFCRDSWKQSLELVEAARNTQLIRNQRS